MDKDIFNSLEDVKDEVLVDDDINAILDTIYSLSHIRDIDGEDTPSYCFAHDITDIFGLSDEEVKDIALENGYNVFNVLPNEEVDGGLIIADKDCSKDLIVKDYEKFFGVDIDVEDIVEDDRETVEKEVEQEVEDESKEVNIRDEVVEENLEDNSIKKDDETKKKKVLMMVDDLSQANATVPTGCIFEFITTDDKIREFAKKYFSGEWDEDTLKKDYSGRVVKDFDIDDDYNKYTDFSIDKNEDGTSTLTLKDYNGENKDKQYKLDLVIGEQEVEDEIDEESVDFDDLSNDTQEEDIIAYHGTTDPGITKFELNHQGYGVPGIFFSNSKELAKLYTYNTPNGLYTCKLNPKSKVVLDANKTPYNDLTVDGEEHLHIQHILKKYSKQCDCLQINNIVEYNGILVNDYIVFDPDIITIIEQESLSESADSLYVGVPVTMNKDKFKKFSSENSMIKHKSHSDSYRYQYYNIPKKEFKELKKQGNDDKKAFNYLMSSGKAVEENLKKDVDKNKNECYTRTNKLIEDLEDEVDFSRIDKFLDRFDEEKYYFDGLDVDIYADGKNPWDDYYVGTLYEWTCWVYADYDYVDDFCKKEYNKSLYDMTQEEVDNIDLDKLYEYANTYYKDYAERKCKDEASSDDFDYDYDRD